MGRKYDWTCLLLLPTAPLKAALVILAAGASIRLGQPKQLVVFRGKTLLRWAAETALAVPDGRVAVVLGKDLGRFREELHTLDVTVLENETWAEGMASSVRLAATWATESGVETLLLLVCDQPFVTTSLLNQLLHQHRETGQAIVASGYENAAGTAVRGVPVLFHRTLFPELLQLSGDRGAQVLLRAHPEAVAVVDFPEGRYDLDTPEELAWLASFN